MNAPRRREIKHIRTPTLRIAFEEQGSPAGDTVVLLHGFPYDPRCYDGVVPILVARGLRVIVPYLRGYGATTFVQTATMRSGQQAAVAQDLIDLLDALGIERATLAGYDWGGRAACIVAALWPRRVHALVSGCGYNIQNIAAAARPQPPEAERRNWYQYYFHSQRGRDGLATYRNEIANLLWRLWSPSWSFDEATFAASAASFANDDFVDIVVHSYRHRYGYAPGDAALAQIESQLAAQPAIGVPAIVLHGDEDGVDPPTAHDGHAEHFLGGYERRILPRVGHNIPQEAPKATAAAILAFHPGG